jgi:drug/metabolite transporter (DMT)-like permease
MPSSQPANNRAPASRWDLPLRILVATGLVLLLTGIAPTIGAHLTGLLSPFPVYAGVLAIFAHRESGGDAANNVLRGLLLGLFSFGAFFFILAIGLSRIGIGLTFLLATATALVIQGLTLRAVRSTRDGMLP